MKDTFEFSFSSGKTLVVHPQHYDLSTPQSQDSLLRNFSRQTFQVLIDLTGKAVLVNMSEVTFVRLVQVKMPDED